MDISVEITGSLERRLKVTVPEAKLNSLIQQRTQKLVKTAKLDGYRPGKIPAKVIEQRYGQPIKTEAIEELVQKSLNDALQQEKLRPVGQPVIQSLTAEAGQPLSYTVTLEVYPEIQLGSLANVSLEKSVVNIEADDVQRVLEQMRKQHVEWESVTRAARDDDKITLDFTRLHAGQAQADSTQKNVSLVLDAKARAEGFAKLVGAHVGAELIIDLPTTTANEAAPQASVKVIAIEAPRAAISDAHLVKILGMETFEELLTQVRAHMQQELDNVIKKQQKNQLIDILLERNQFELPKALVTKEQEHLAREWLERQRQQEPSATKLPAELQAKLPEIARRRVSLSLIFSHVIQQHAITVDQARLQQQIMQIAGSFQEPQAIITLIQRKPEVLNGIRAQVLEEQAIDKLLEEVQYTEKASTYADIMHMDTTHSTTVELAGSAPQLLHEQAHVHDEHCQHAH